VAEFTVHFLPGNKKVKISDKISILDAAHKSGIQIHSECGGKGTCGKCKIRLYEKNHSFSVNDEKFFAPDELAEGWRLACQTYLKHDTKVEVPSFDTLESMRILSRGKRKKFTFKPAVHKEYAELTPPTLENPQSYVSLLKTKFNITKFEPSVIKSLPEKVKNSGFKLTAVLKNNELLSVESGDTRSECYGIAIDLGTTTVVAFLVDLYSGTAQALSSRVNSQITFGADIITRINYAITKKKNLDTLNREVVSTLNKLINEVIKKASVKRENIYEIVIAGNTVMEHLLVPVDPEPLSHSPFAPVFSEAVRFKAGSLGLNVNQNSDVFIFPNIGGFIGGDIVSGMLTHNFEKNSRIKIAVDIGTNGETVLGSKHRIIACSNAMGPAFEGAHIMWGMPAVAGAINKVDFTEDDLEFTVIGRQEPAGICGSALIDLVAGLLNKGILYKRGRFINDDNSRSKVPEALLRRIILHDNQPAFLIHKGKDREIIITQPDIMQIQLAKAAICSAIKILLKILDVTLEDVSEIFIAGAFGNYIRPENALRIGLIPDFPVKKIKPVGNAAVEGAIRALLSTSERNRAETLAKKIEHVELSIQPNFQDEFTDALLFP